MTGVSVDTAIPGIDPFKMAFEGGQSFMARLQELGQKKDEYDAALAALNLGKSAADAYVEADVQRKDASAKLAEAAKVLDDARQTAAGIVAKAKEDAAAEVARGQSDASAARNAAAQVKCDADNHAAKTRDDAAAELADAKALKAAADSVHQMTVATLADLKAQQAAADQAKADADARAASLKESAIDLRVAAAAALEKLR